ncbi:ComEC/Rec2 family competence protein [Pseudarthrobacter sp. P1]|uniref:ComEC/Rec2 family competence protein n=1 Tax=Pseudarthrobacter sp. P1 TaxID=3418418 RepID=UPI003CF2896C
MAGLALAGVGAALLILGARPSDARFRAVFPVAVAVFCAAAVFAGVAATSEVRGRGQLAGAVASGATIGAQVVIASEARAAGGFDGRILVAATLVEGTAGGVRFAADAPVVLIGGADWAGIPPGTRVRLAGTLRPSDPGERSVAFLTAKTAPLERQAPSGWESTTASIRQGWAEAAQRRWGPASSDVVGLLRGMVTGERSALPADLSDAMKTVGLTHLTAVSGANCTIVLATLLLLARSLRIPRWPAALLACAGLLGFVAVVGPDPSVLRAAVMGGLGAAAMLTGRPRRIGAWLSCAVVGLLIADPWLATDFAFILSVLATLGLLLVGQRCARWLAVWMPHWLAQAIAIPVAAQLLCAPAIVLLSPRLAVFAVPANMVAAPVVALVTMVGTLGLAAALWLPWLAEGCAGVAGLGVGWVASTARFAAALPGASLPWPEGAGGAVLMAALSLVFVAGLWASVNAARLRPLLVVLVRWLPAPLAAVAGFPLLVALLSLAAGIVAWILASAASG